VIHVLLKAGLYYTFQWNVWHATEGGGGAGGGPPKRVKIAGQVVTMIPFVEILTRNPEGRGYKPYPVWDKFLDK
jgi:hypothetical protein